MEFKQIKKVGRHIKQTRGWGKKGPDKPGRSRLEGRVRRVRKKVRGGQKRWLLSSSGTFRRTRLPKPHWKNDMRAESFSGELQAVGGTNRLRTRCPKGTFQIHEEEQKNARKKKAELGSTTKPESPRAGCSASPNGSGSTSKCSQRVPGEKAVPQRRPLVIKKEKKREGDPIKGGKKNGCERFYQQTEEYEKKIANRGPGKVPSVRELKEIEWKPHGQKGVRRKRKPLSRPDAKERGSEKKRTVGVQRKKRRQTTRHFCWTSTLVEESRSIQGKKRLTKGKSSRQESHSVSRMPQPSI